jgi:hypothetical protein
VNNYRSRNQPWKTQLLLRIKQLTTHAILDFESNTIYTFKKQSFFNILMYKICSYEGETVNRPQNGSKTAVIDVKGFLGILLGSSTVQLQDSLGRRRAFA